MRYSFIAMALAVMGQSLHSAHAQIRRIYVPADRVEEWPKGDWVPVKSETLSQYISSLPSERKSQPETRIDRAVYTARFLDGHLKQGTFSATLNVGTADKKRRIDFDTLGMTWTSLNASRGKAVFGTTIAGRLVAQIESGNAIQGTWTSFGKQLFDETEFRLKLLAARNSVIEITLPANLSLDVSGASFYYKSRRSSGDGDIWTIQLGNRRDCTIRVVPEQISRFSPVAIEEKHNWFVQKPTVRLASEYDFRISDRRNNFKLTLTTPPSLQIEQININGQQVQSYTLKSSKTAKKLEIDVPLQTRGARYRLLIVARCPLLMGRQWKVPLIRLNGHQRLSSVHSFRFEDQIRPQNFSNPGFRLVGIEEESAGFPKLEFEQEEKNSTLSMYLSEPDASIECVTISTFYQRRFLQRIKSVSEFQCRDGSLSSLRLSLPSAWSLNGIQCIDANSREIVPVKWNSKSQKGERDLNIQLQDPIGAGNSILVQVEAFQTVSVRDKDALSGPVQPRTGKTMAQFVQYVGQEVETSSSQFWSRSDQKKVEAQLAVWKSLLGANVIEENAVVLQAAVDDAAVGPPLDVQIVDRNRMPPGVPTQIDGKSTETELSPNNVSSKSDPVVQSRTRHSLAARCKISSLLSDRFQGHHFHHAKYEFLGDVGGEKVVIKEPGDSEISSILVNGNAIFLQDPKTGTREFQLQLGNTSDLQNIDVFYRSASDEKIVVEVPNVNFKIVGLEWELESQDGTQLTKVSVDRHAQDALDWHDISWIKGLFGPFVSSKTQTLPPAIQHGQSLKSDSRTMSVILPATTQRIFIHTAANRFEQRLSFSLFFVALLVLIRVNHVPSLWRLRMTIALAVVSFVFGVFASDRVASFVGAIALASILAVLWSLVAIRISVVFQLLTRLWQSRTKRKVQQIAIVMLAVPIGVSMLSAADATKEPTIGNILIPFENVKSIDRLPEVVYVDRLRFAELKAWYLENREDSGDAVIQTAEYTPKVVSPGVIGVQAKYSVSVNKDALPYRLVLPLNEVTFPGTRSCLVNGEEGEMIANGADKGVTVTLPGVEELSSIPTESISRGNVTERQTCNVEILFIPNAIDGGNPDLYSFGVPGVHFSSWTNPENMNGFATELLTKPIDGGQNGKGRVLLGPVERIDFRVLENGEPAQPNGQTDIVANASMSTLFRPGMKRMDASSQVIIRENETNKVSYMAFRIPSDCHIKDVTGEYVSRFYRSDKQNRQILVVELEEALSDQTTITIDYSCLKTFDWRQTEIELPMFELLPQLGILDVEQDSNHLAVLQSPLQISMAEEMPKSLRRLSSSEFLESWDEELEGDQIELAYAVVGKPPIILNVRGTRREVQVEKTSEISIEDESLLLETLIRFGQVSNELLVLHVNWDSRFRIESVFSEHDGVQKKVTPLALKNKLLLLLGQPLEPRQTIFIKGKKRGNGLPIQTTKISLPWLANVPVEYLSSELQIRNSTIRPIEVLESNDWELEAATPVFPEEGQNGQVVRKFRASRRNRQQSIRLRYTADVTKPKAQSQNNDRTDEKQNNTPLSTENPKLEPKQTAPPRREYVIHQLTNVDLEHLVLESFFVVSSEVSGQFEIKMPAGSEMLNSSVNGKAIELVEQNKQLISVPIPQLGLNAVRLVWLQPLQTGHGDPTTSISFPKAIKHESNIEPLLLLPTDSAASQMKLGEKQRIDAQQYLDIRNGWIQTASAIPFLTESIRKELSNVWISRINPLLDSENSVSREQLPESLNDSVVKGLVDFDLNVFHSQDLKMYVLNSTDAIEFSVTTHSNPGNPTRSFVAIGVILCGLISLAILAPRVRKYSERLRGEIVIVAGVVWVLVCPVTILGIAITGLGVLLTCEQLLRKGESSAPEPS